jgi:20S proteasome alpha/beta subunit
MTLLVGIFCNQGAVLAADKQASHGAFGHLTVGQPTTKIKALGDSILFASSGPIGLGQQLCHIVDVDQKEIPNRNYHLYATLLQRKFREVVDPALQTAANAARVIGQAAQSDAVCGSLLAGRFKDGIKLIEISPQCGVEHLTDTVPFV